MTRACNSDDANAVANNVSSSHCRTSHDQDGTMKIRAAFEDIILINDAQNLRVEPENLRCSTRMTSQVCTWTLGFSQTPPCATRRRAQHSQAWESKRLYSKSWLCESCATRFIGIAGQSELCSMCSTENEQALQRNSSLDTWPIPMRTVA